MTNTGPNPREITVPVGSRVTFINDDFFPHDISGGPDPSTRDCPEIDAVGFIVPGQGKQTNPFETARTCEFHDHSFHSPLYNGRIVIQ
jgi:plastocyanin